MRDKMKNGDLVLFYHSNCNPPHVAGIARVVNEGYPDHTSWDIDSKYFDPKSSIENPRWIMVDIEPIVKVDDVPLHDMRDNIRLEGMPLLQRGQRLSVQPVDENHFRLICEMGGIDYDNL